MTPYLLTEKYRPSTLDEYVWKNAEHRARFEAFIKDRQCPHMLFAGPPGTGKTSLARLLLKQFDIPRGDILEIDASRERKIEDIQSKIEAFISTWALGDTGVKYIILDEADSLSALAQRMLRNGMETFSDHTRFILTCNYAERIIAPLQSRLQVFKFETLDRTQFFDQIVHVLIKEGAVKEDELANEFEKIEKIVDLTYPDMRRAINLGQQCIQDGVLISPSSDAGKNTKDYVLEAADLIRAGRILDARKKLISSAIADEYPDIFRYFYQNLDLWGDEPAEQDEALLEIRRGLVYHSQIADPEINLSATLVALSMIRTKS